MANKKDIIMGTAILIFVVGVILGTQLNLCEECENLDFDENTRTINLNETCKCNNNLMSEKEKRCFNESKEIWNSVNVGINTTGNLQESYTKNRISACASMYYITCINDNYLWCSHK